MYRETAWSLIGRALSLSVFLENDPPRRDGTERHRWNEARSQRPEAPRDFPSRNSGHRR